MLYNYPDILTVRDIRDILSIGRNKAYELLEAGTIRGFRIGRGWRVSKEEITRLIRDTRY